MTHWSEMVAFGGALTLILGFVWHAIAVINGSPGKPAYLKALPFILVIAGAIGIMIGLSTFGGHG